jgi:hypothetical protein
MRTGTAQELSSAEMAGIQWRTGTRSQSNGDQYVEAGPLSDGSGRVAVQHSRHPKTAVIVHTRAEWTVFLAGAKDGKFDFTADLALGSLSPTNPPKAFLASGSHTPSASMGSDLERAATKRSQSLWACSAAARQRHDEAGAGTPIFSWFALHPREVGKPAGRGIDTPQWNVHSIG